MLVECRFQVVFTGTTTGAYTRTDNAVHHVHMAVTPCAQLFVYLQQVVEQLKRQLQHRVAAVQHDEKRCPSGFWR